MLKDYRQVKYQDCPRCGSRQGFFQTEAYFQCYNEYCDFVEDEYKIETKREKRVQGIVEEMSRHLLINDKDYNGFLPLFNYPDEAVKSGDFHAGWYTPSNNTINIPRKSFYLPNKEITEITAHETAHVPIEPLVSENDTTDGHIIEWNFKYMDYRRELFSSFSWFAHSINSEAWFSINQTKENYRKKYGYILESEYKLLPSDLKFKPHEDD